MRNCDNYCRPVYRSYNSCCQNGGYVLSGNGAPSSLIGNNCDFYIDVVNSLIYGPKLNGIWDNSPMSLRGIRGPQGIPGPEGLPGLPGTGFLYGSDAPDDDLGNIGDFYIEVTGDDLYLYGPKTDDPDNPWGPGILLTGGTGTVFLSGQEAPTSEEGNDGDFYLQYIPSDFPEGETLTYLYGPKTGGAWPPGVLLTGANGADGVDGSSGSDGTFVYSGSLPPDNSLGEDGDFYIQYEQTDQGIIVWLYGPKENGVWPILRYRLTGEQGFTGEDGENPPNVIFAVKSPEPADGNNGDFYFVHYGGDTDLSAEFYGPKTAGSWGSPVSLIGSSGSDGSDSNIVIVGSGEPPITDFGNFYFQQTDSETNFYGPYGSQGWPGPYNLDGIGSDGVQVESDAINVLLQYDNVTDTLVSTDIQLENQPLQNYELSQGYTPSTKIIIDADNNYLLYYDDKSGGYVLIDVDNNNDVVSEFPVQVGYTQIGGCVSYPIVGIISYIDDGVGTITYRYEIFDATTQPATLKNLFTYNTTASGSVTTLLPAININDDVTQITFQVYAGNGNNVNYYTYYFDSNYDITNLIGPETVLNVPRYPYDNLFISSQYLFTAEKINVIDTDYVVVTRLFGNNSDKNTTTFAAYPNYLPVVYGNLLALTPIGTGKIYFFDITDFDPNNPQVPIAETTSDYTFAIGQMSAKYLAITTFDTTFPNGIMSYLFSINDLSQSNTINPFIAIPVPSNQIIQTVAGNNFFAQAIDDTVFLYIFSSVVNKRILLNNGTITEPIITTIEYPDTGISHPADSQAMDFSIEGVLVGQINSGGISNISDPKFKKNMAPSDDGLDLLTCLDPYTFSFVNEDDNIIHYGFSAQQLLEKYTSKYGVEDKNFGAIFRAANGTMFVNYNEFISMNISAIKQLKEKNNELDMMIQTLEEKLRSLQN